MSATQLEIEVNYGPSKLSLSFHQLPTLDSFWQLLQRQLLISRDSVILRVCLRNSQISTPINAPEEWAAALQSLDSPGSSFSAARLVVHLTDLSLTDSEVTPEHPVSLSLSMARPPPPSAPKPLQSFPSHEHGNASNPVLSASLPASVLAQKSASPAPPYFRPLDAPDHSSVMPPSRQDQQTRYDSPPLTREAPLQVLSPEVCESIKSIAASHAQSLSHSHSLLSLCQNWIQAFDASQVTQLTSLHGIFFQTFFLCVCVCVQKH
ncbi:MAG: hypothetical protein Q8P67_18310 [archaeon]|nr:hypothetical protein [archaeon]